MLLICRLLQAFLIILVARIIMSWFPVTPGSALSSVYSLLFRVTEPILGPLRRMMPPLGMLDLSPIIVFFGITLLMNYVC